MDSRSVARLEIKYPNWPATAKREGGQTVRWLNPGGEYVRVGACEAGEWAKGLRKRWFDRARSPPSRR